MKIEIGESLLLSWLRHIKECQIVQTNWKASSKWMLNNKDKLVQIMQSSSDYFKEKYNYDLYKGTVGLDQLLAQAEIDVIGISFSDGENHLYAVDVAFHESGLNYGLRDETVSRVIKKCIRTALCIHGYYNINKATIIFASPKINPGIYKDIIATVDDMLFAMKEADLDFDIRIIANEDFSDKILEPLLNVLDGVADTSELFMRSLQMYNLFAAKPQKATINKQVTKRISTELKPINYNGIDGIEEMKIGVVVRTILRRILESGTVTPDEIEKMQTKEYSKLTFDIQYPLLKKLDYINEQSPLRYYSSPIEIFGEKYFLCSEWFEVPANNDRPYLEKWLIGHQNTQNA